MTKKKPKRSKILRTNRDRVWLRHEFFKHTAKSVKERREDSGREYHAWVARKTVWWADDKAETIGYEKVTMVKKMKAWKYEKMAQERAKEKAKEIVDKIVTEVVDEMWRVDLVDMSKQKKVALDLLKRELNIIIKDIKDREAQWMEQRSYLSRIEKILRMIRRELGEPNDIPFSDNLVAVQNIISAWTKHKDTQIIFSEKLKELF